MLGLNLIHVGKWARGMRSVLRGYSNRVGDNPYEYGDIQTLI